MAGRALSKLQPTIHLSPINMRDQATRQSGHKTRRIAAACAEPAEAVRERFRGLVTVQGALHMPLRKVKNPRKIPGNRDTSRESVNESP